ncbi:MAG TPA: hypothetical protein VFD27_11940 [Chthoniobacteraceae bacterium]|jgi:hypothetical protein|nr:hypothetical protein [Chthoniobacteraceae bacterium]
MATVEEIEQAIRALSPGERIRLAHSLPALIPELDGDVLWEASVRDSAKRPSLTAALDELDAEFARDPERFRPVRVSDFELPR